MAATRYLTESLASLAICITAIAVLSLALGACQASEEAMRGATGEFCQETADCRAGLTCSNNTCGCENAAACDACEVICARHDQCEVTLNNCSGVCQNTIEQWSEPSIDIFRDCFVDDLSCSDLAATDQTAQTCYDQLPPIPDARAQRCDDLHEAAQSCGADSAPLREFASECPVMARTRSDDVWAYTDACHDRMNEGFCPDIIDCLNEVFELDPEFSSVQNGGTDPREDLNDDVPNGFQPG